MSTRVFVKVPLTSIDSKNTR